jgi:hypothetical protein
LDYHLRRASDPPFDYSSSKVADIQWAATKDQASTLDYFEALRYAQWLALRGYAIAWEEQNPETPVLNPGPEI